MTLKETIELNINNELDKIDFNLKVAGASITIIESCRTVPGTNEHASAEEAMSHLVNLVKRLKGKRKTLILMLGLLGDSSVIADDQESSDILQGAWAMAIDALP